MHTIMQFNIGAVAAAVGGSVCVYSTKQKSKLSS